LDFKLIFRILQKGLHYISEGADFVNLIASRMNNSRLSTSNKPKIDIDLEKIEEFIKQPSNYEIREGKIFILSLNRYKVDNKNITVTLVKKSGEVFKSFSSIVECAKYLGIARSTVNNRALNGTYFLYKNILNNEEIRISLLSSSEKN
jgi:hypothetical protein